MRGREEQGINLLNYVYDEFLKLQNYEDASQCLANIATYYDKTDQKAKHRIAIEETTVARNQVVPGDWLVD